MSCFTFHKIIILFFYFSILLFAVEFAYADGNLQKSTNYNKKDSTFIAEKLEKAKQLALSKPDSAQLLADQVVEYAKKQNNEVGLMRGYSMLGIIKFVQQDL